MQPQQPAPSPRHVASYGTDPYRTQPGGQFVLWHLDQERQKEQERAQREAVQQHFEESLRLASQKTYGRLIAQHSQQSHVDTTNNKGNWSPSLAKISSGHRQQQAKWSRLVMQRAEVKATKKEPSFNLYGYQPFPQMYITQAQLKAREEHSLMPREDGQIMPYSNPAPAHQGSIARCSLTQEEPQNLVKRQDSQDNKAAYSSSLIQQGLVPNPLYSPTAQQSVHPTCKVVRGEPLSLLVRDSASPSGWSPLEEEQKALSPIPSAEDSKQGSSSVQSDSDTHVTPAPSPAPSTCTTVSNCSSSHRKLKKAWLERHSEIEKEKEEEEGSSSEVDKRMPEDTMEDPPKKEPKRRGRKPKRPDLLAGPPRKKLARSTEKPTLVELKKSGKPFLQDGSCYDVAPKLPKCRECRMTPHQRNKKMPNIFCRFYAFRKLRYGKNGTMLSGGFSEPSDASEEDLQLWLPRNETVPKELEVETAQIILSHVGDQFCDLVEQEREAQTLHMGQDKSISWKRVVQGVREMCDVCETTLFNIHWVCHKCGFVVCIDCYKAKKNGSVKAEESPPRDRDEYQWLLCSNRQVHEQERLMMTQIIAGNALWQVGQDLHRVRTEWDIPAHCGCSTFQSDSSESCSNGMCKQLMSAVSKCFAGDREAVNRSRGGSPLSVLADVALNSKLQDFSTLRELLVRPTGKKPSLDQVMSSALQSEEQQLSHFCRRFPSSPRGGREPLAIRVCTLAESLLLYPKVRHSWLCNGKLLVLHEPHNKHNLAVFQEQWRRGQPVLVTDVCENLDMDLWHPDGFCRDFGDIRNDLVNCRTGNILPNQPMRKFWEGFENFSKRMKDEDGEYMLLKLKDWPPGDDFSDMLPSRFSDLMKVLPLPEYTHRDGVLNLAGRLPDCFVRPDLGPKMYNAYGSALYPNKGTTNLHLDVSDAVNVMVYVGIPKDGKDEEHISEALKAIDEGACDALTRKRVRENNAKPGALWHIYNARDADKIRDLLNKVAVERGETLEAHHDPIHDQSWYLDHELRERLFREYAVEGYAIAQCLGEAVFIPAGAPHQVRNLHSCIKVAEDFVSPENIAHCFSLTNEFRQLSDNHTNHEDKLQIKNVIYHAVKDALVILRAHQGSCK